MTLTALFKEFFSSKKAEGFILIACTAVSLVVANSAIGESYLHLLHSKIDLSFLPLQLNYSTEHWINDGLMAIFFLLVGLEIERELYVGELSSFKNAVLPVVAAVGGMVIPAVIHFSINGGTPTQSGFGIPMATDIAFALGILSLAGNKVPLALKVFLTALAIIDDLGAIAVIAVFYTQGFSFYFFVAALCIWAVLFILGKRKVYFLPVYILGGIAMWYCMLQSGVHATIAGVLLAFAIPFHKVDRHSPSYKLQHHLHYPVAFFILPLFALANTAILFPSDLWASMINNNSAGIILGLLIGKPLGILGISYLAVKAGWASLPPEISWLSLAGASLLAGIGFTMSIFITNLAFQDPLIITGAKISILVASFAAAILGLIILKKVK